MLYRIWARGRYFIKAFAAVPYVCLLQILDILSDEPLEFDFLYTFWIKTFGNITPGKLTSLSEVVYLFGAVFLAVILFGNSMEKDVSQIGSVVFTRTLSRTGWTLKGTLRLAGGVLVYSALFVACGAALLLRHADGAVGSGVFGAILFSGFMIFFMILFACLCCELFALNLGVGAGALAAALFAAVLSAAGILAYDNIFMMVFNPFNMNITLTESSLLLFAKAAANTGYAFVFSAALSCYLDKKDIF